MIEFGKHIRTKYLDADGSFERSTKNYRKGVAVETNYFEVRKRVKNETEELAETIRFMKEKKGKNRSTRVELPKQESNFYYLVLCWED